MRLRRSSKLLVPAGVVLGSLALVAGVLAYSATTYINLTVAGADVVDNGAHFVQGGVGAGTGTFDPFLTIQSNGDTEKGYNTTQASGEFDTFFGGGRTHPLQAAAIPAVAYKGGLYREFSLDANDQGSDDYMSIDEFKVFLDDQNNLTSYTDGTDSFGTDTGTPAQKIYDLGSNVVILMRSQSLTPGSGVSDITALVPDSLFPASCYYGSTTCNQWVYLFTAMGGFDGAGSPPVTGKNWNVTAGFEEWRTRLLPVVNVTKTADTSYTQPYTWTVDKKVKVNGTCVDAATVNLLKGDSQAADWCITPTRTAGTPTNPTVSGSITITNPTGGTVISHSIDAVISSVTDVINQGSDVSVTPSCPVTFPYTLKAQQTLTCTYTKAVSSTTTGTNTATANLSGPTQAYSGSAAVDFATATVTPLNATATLTDLAGPLNQAAVSGTTVYVSKTYACNADQGTKNNTATVTPNDGGTPASDTASLTINCASLTVTKDASTTYTRTFPWTINKSVTPATWTLFTGDSGTSRYTVAVTKGTGTDDTFAVSGNIHVHNPATIPATLTGVSDVMTGSLTATVDCGVGVSFPYTLAAGGDLVCTYSRSLPTKDALTNTATATLQNHSYTSAGVASDSGTTDFSGTADVTFGAPSALVNDSINVDDTNGGTWLFSASGSVNYEKTFTCDTDKGKHDNTATIRETGLRSSASVTVSCYEITVSKTATTSFTRTFHWTIDKYSTDVNGGALTLNPGESYIDYPYTIKVDLAPTPYTDSDWAVAGQITIHNPAPMAAKINSVSDEISGPIAVSVDCGVGVTFPYMLAAGGDFVCSYSASLPDATSRTNTATAVRQNRSFDYLGVASDKATTTSTSGTAAVTFGAPTSLVDETVTIVDDFGTPADLIDDKSFGPLSYTDTLPAYFTYNRTFGPYTSAECGDIHVDNTATLTTNDTKTTVSDTWNLTITIPCPTGCTLTQGYWKTHSIFGPVPLSKADPTWDLLGALGPATVFFNSGQTWYQVFWTAPKGGNVYYILAHQYEAAKLNILSGAASTPAVGAAIAWAETFFATYTPTSNFSKTVKSDATKYAGILGSYNEGLIGPGHCSVDGLSKSAQQ